MPFIKLNPPKFLRETQMLITDSDPDSTYFEVAEVPSFLTGGKNLIMLGGNKRLLKPGSNIEIEVTDVKGNPVFHEVNRYIEAGTNKRAVSIYVYESTPQGVGFITIAGVAERRPNGNKIPSDWTNRLNVKWTKRIRMYPFRKNTTRVILQKPPVIKIKEKVREYLVPEGGITTELTTNSGSHITYTFEPEPANPYSPTDHSKQNFGGILISSVPYFSASMVGSTIEFNNIVPILENTATQIQTLAVINGTTDNTFHPQITEVINSTKAKVNSDYRPRITTEFIYPPEAPGGATMGTA